MPNTKTAPAYPGHKTKKGNPVPPMGPNVELFGHVSLVEGYDVTGFIGCDALVDLRDTAGKTVAVLTTEPRLQSLLETALATGYCCRSGIASR